MKFILLLIFVLSMVCNAAKCSERYLYTTSPEHIDVYLDSIYQVENGYPEINEWNYTYYWNGGRLDSVVLDHMEVGDTNLTFFYFSDSTKLSGSGIEIVYISHVSGDTLLGSFRIYKDGVKTDYEDLYIMDSVSLEKKGDSLIGSAYLRNDTLFILDETGSSFVVNDLGADNKCSIYSNDGYGDPDTAFVEILSTENGFCIEIKQNGTSGKISKYFYNYKKGSSAIGKASPRKKYGIKKVAHFDLLGRRRFK